MPKVVSFEIFVFMILFHGTSFSQVPTNQNSLVNIRDFSSKIRVEMRYSTSHNFVGRRLKGYQKDECLLSSKVAKALVLVQKDAEKKGLSLLLFDCYRPKEAIDDMVLWAKDLADFKTKLIYYPGLKKQTLLGNYISSHSSHRLGVSVDLTLIKKSEVKNYFESNEDCRIENRKKDGNQLNMGTLFDCFSVKSHTKDKSISADAQKNRKMLKALMKGRGFTNYAKEWWHYRFRKKL